MSEVDVLSLMADRALYEVDPDLALELGYTPPPPDDLADVATGYAAALAAAVLDLGDEEWTAIERDPSVRRALGGDHADYLRALVASALRLAHQNLEGRPT